MQCSTTARHCGGIRAAAAPRGARRLTRAVVVKADSSANGAVPQHVQEARAWIDGWKFRQTVKVSTLEEGIAKAADYLENTKNLRNAKRYAEEAAARRTVQVNFEVCKQVKYGSSLKLVGGAEEFGAWSPEAAPKLEWSNGDVWKLALDLKAGTYEFKLVTYADSGDAEWEDGGNRVVVVQQADEDGTSFNVSLQSEAPAAV